MIPASLSRCRTISPLLASLLLASSSNAAATVAHGLRPTAFAAAYSVAIMARRSARLRTERSLASAAGVVVVDDPSRDNADADASSASERKYGAMRVAELRDLLRERGLAVSGVKSALVERLRASSSAEEGGESRPKTKRARARKSPPESLPQAPPAASAVDCLPRTRELQLQLLSARGDAGADLAVIGVDEAGRGPLAGPVVAAAAIVPCDVAGIVDSKKITREEERERLYEELIASPGVRYAVAVVSARRIDEINVLQATLEGMRMAVEGAMNVNDGTWDARGKGGNAASAERTEASYVIAGGDVASDDPPGNPPANSYYALIDGNRVPKDMPCPAESVVKGDGREYSIGAASILAKVTRDRLMHEYDKKYPQFNLSQHKGYPTAAHMSAVARFGASPIHRRTFAPLKHMRFDEDGKVIG